MLKQNLTIFLLILSTLSFSQYRLDEEVSFIYVDGTSTLHDWTVTVNEMNGSITAELDQGQLTRISSVNITVPVSSIKSEKPKMDENMYKALKSQDNPKIKYKANQLSVNGTKVVAIGKFTIAGVTRSVETTLSYLIVGDHLKFYGQLKLKMTDYNVTPPEFLLGAFKTGDEVVIKYYFMFCNGIKNK